MDQHKAVENHIAGGAERASSAYVPPLQRTKGQPPPIAANGGLSYMSFDRDGDAGTVAATEAALRQLAEGQGQALSEMLESAPAGALLKLGDAADTVSAHQHTRCAKCLGEKAGPASLQCRGVSGNRFQGKIDAPTLG